MAHAFRTDKLSSPVHDARGRFDAVLAAQLRGYTFENPETKQSQAIPAAVVAMVAAAKAMELHRAIGQLVVGALFFAMRSCEFSDVGGPRRTRIITVGDIECRRDGRKTDVDDEGGMAAADAISLTFRKQKNGEKGTTVTQHQTSGTTIGGVRLCPVASFARLVARMRRYEPSETEWAERNRRPINLVTTAEGTTLMTSHQISHHLRATALQYGEERLGFLTANIGAHSLRAGATTAMFFAGVPAETIQLIGRWRSQTSYYATF